MSDWDDGATFLDKSQSVAKQNQKSLGLFSTLNKKIFLCQAFLYRTCDDSDKNRLIEEMSSNFTL